MLTAGCSIAAVPTSTPTPRPTATYIPSNMEPPTPIGTPVGEWFHIPIMPGATAGRGDDLGYTFTIQASPEEVEAFYKDHMPKLGWQLDESGVPDPNAPLLVFKKDSSIVTISYFPHGDELVVLLVR